MVCPPPGFLLGLCGVVHVAGEARHSWGWKRLIETVFPYHLLSDGPGRMTHMWKLRVRFFQQERPPHQTTGRVGRPQGIGRNTQPREFMRQRPSSL